MKKLIIILPLVLFVLACFAQEKKGQNDRVKNGKITIGGFTYTNLITGVDFRDTHILRDGDTWYAVGTCAPHRKSVSISNK
jgi:hypothetical protein